MGGEFAYTKWIFKKKKTNWASRTISLAAFYLDNFKMNPLIQNLWNNDFNYSRLKKKIV